MLFGPCPNLVYGWPKIVSHHTHTITRHLFGGMPQRATHVEDVAAVRWQHTSTPSVILPRPQCRRNDVENVTEPPTLASPLPALFSLLSATRTPPRRPWPTSKLTTSVFSALQASLRLTMCTTASVSSSYMTSAPRPRGKTARVADHRSCHRRSHRHARPGHHGLPWGKP